VFKLLFNFFAFKDQNRETILQTNQMNTKPNRTRQNPVLSSEHAQQNAESLSLAGLSAAPPQEQKQMLGERLYPLIYTVHPEWAGKITGMLLEMDNSELLHMLESPESLNAKVFILDLFFFLISFFVYLLIMNLRLTKRSW